MTASVDVLQILNDDTNLTPFYHAAADVLGAQVLDAQGNVTQRGLADAGIEVLSRVFAAAHDAQGNETCSQEIDPNGAIAAMLGEHGDADGRPRSSAHRGAHGRRRPT